MNQSDPMDFVEQLNERMMEGIEQNVEAQVQFVDAWREAIEQTTDDEFLESGASGIASAYEVWLDASLRMAQRATQVAEGERLDPNEFRDIWLRAANESFQEIMQTTAFARATGEGVGSMLDFQRQTDEAMQDMMEAMGMATVGHVEEVGERLVELERRQHAVEQRLDEILDHLEGDE